MNRIFSDVFELVGNTPAVKVAAEELAGTSFYVKLESSNPTGSVKDRGCVYLIRDMLERAELTPGKTILDASSGNMACAIAYFGRVLGHPTRVFSNSKLTLDKRTFIEFFGAELDIEGDFTIEGNRACRRIAEAEPERYCFLDQLHNEANPRAHFETTGPEILETFPDLKLLVASLGSGGTLAGTAEFLKNEVPDLLVAAVEAESGTRIPGTGAFVDGDYVTPFIERGYEKGLFDLRVRVSYEEASRATLRLRDQGIFAGVQTGGVFHSAMRVARENGVEGDVVFISGDSGWKNMEKLQALKSSRPFEAT